MWLKFGCFNIVWYFNRFSVFIVRFDVLLLVIWMGVVMLLVDDGLLVLMIDGYFFWFGLVWVVVGKVLLLVEWVDGCFVWVNVFWLMVVILVYIYIDYVMDFVLVVDCIGV